MRNIFLVLLLVSFVIVPFTHVNGKEHQVNNDLIFYLEAIATAKGKGLEGLSATGVVNVPEENATFKKISVQGKSGSYLVSGLAKPPSGSFYYTVEDGHNEQIPETKVELSQEGEEWKSFTIEITIPKERLPDNGSLIVNLYEKKENGIVNPYPMILEKFY